MFASDHYHVIGEAIGFNDEMNLFDKVDQLDRPALQIKNRRRGVMPFAENQFGKITVFRDDYTRLLRSHRQQSRI